MLYSSFVVSALCAVALAAPTIPSAPPAGMKVVNDYFNLLAAKVATKKGFAAPVCDLSKATLPVASPTPLPPVSEGLVLRHVGIGRGTQNYTCSQTNATAAPVAAGAIATLYNASCIAASYPDLLAALPNVALQFNLTSADQRTLSPSNLLISGHHFFSNATTPDFDLGTAGVGFAPCAKNNSVPAPADASKGQGGVGLGAVPWLKLVTRLGATGGLEEVYRINTAGGVAPAVCAGMPAAFQIEYAAEYWFFGSA